MIERIQGAKMKIAGICFSGSGLELEKKIQKKLIEASVFNDLCAEWFFRGRFAEDESGLSKRLEGSVRDWTAEHFNHCDVLLFIGACGIAVRAIAPFVRDKRHDPAVIVMDEMGRFCIPILSGHVGGANEFAAELADVLGSIPVITTATDIHNKFAVDVYAKKHNLTMSNATYAKEVSAAVVSGEPVGFYTNFPVEGELPEGLVWSEKLEQALEDNGERSGGISLGIYISPSYNRAYFDHTLWLIPRCLTVGIECRKDADAREIEQFIRDTLNSFSLYEEAVRSIAVPDSSGENPGLAEFSRRSGIPIHIIHPEKPEEKSAPLCEQCAFLDGGRELLTTRDSTDGIACAVALIDWNVVF